MTARVVGYVVRFPGCPCGRECRLVLSPMDGGWCRSFTGRRSHVAVWRTNGDAINAARAYLANVGDTVQATSIHRVVRKVKP